MSYTIAYENPTLTGLDITNSSSSVVQQILTGNNIISGTNTFSVLQNFTGINNASSEISTATLECSGALTCGSLSISGVGSDLASFSTQSLAVLQGSEFTGLSSFHVLPVHLGYDAPIATSFITKDYVDGVEASLLASNNIFTGQTNTFKDIVSGNLNCSSLSISGVGLDSASFTAQSLAINTTSEFKGIATFDVPPVLSGASIISHSIPDLALTVNVPLINATNVFSAQTNTFKDIVSGNLSCASLNISGSGTEQASFSAQNLSVSNNSVFTVLPTHSGLDVPVANSLITKSYVDSASILTLDNSFSGTNTFTKNITVGNGCIIGNPSNNQYSVTIGKGAMSNNCPNSTAIGYNALTYAQSTSSNNTAVGCQSSFTGGGNYNSSFGSSSLGNNNTGIGNCAFGYQALSLTNANYNVAIGYQAGFRSNANDLIAIGANTLPSSSGISNVAIGSNSQNQETSGQYNTSIGESSLNRNVDGSNNSALGYNAGSNLTTGSKNTFIGSNSQPPNAIGSNQIVIGTVTETTYIAGASVLGALSCTSLACSSITDAGALTSTTAIHSGLVTCNNGLTIATGQLSGINAVFSGSITCNGETDTGSFTSTTAIHSGLVSANAGLTIPSGQNLNALGNVIFSQSQIVLTSAANIAVNLNSISRNIYTLALAGGTTVTGITFTNIIPNAKFDILLQAGTGAAKTINKALTAGGITIYNNLAGNTSVASNSQWWIRGIALSATVIYLEFLNIT